MTVRLYYTDPSCRRFEATVVSVRPVDGRPAIVLDRTAFYPTSGGQPFDLGHINDATVVDVVDDAEEILHVVSSDIPVGQRVTGVVDDARRFDHTQQHTGQHILSAAFDRAFGNRTVGFHMGADVSTIDLAGPVSPIDAARAERDANAVVWDNRQVSIRFVTAAEAATLPLRKESAREGVLRLIEVRDFDLSACGGTHVARTGEVGLIAVTGAERFKGGSRVTFVCGGRALRAFGELRESVTQSVRTLSVLPAEVPAAIDRLQGEAREMRKSMRGLQEQLARHEAIRIVQTASPDTQGGDIVHRLDGWDAVGLKSVALAAVGLGATSVVLVAAGDPTIVVAATTREGADARALWAALQTKFGGKGGGTPSLVQGALAVDAERVCLEARRLLEARPSRQA